MARGARGSLHTLASEELHQFDQPADFIEIAIRSDKLRSGVLRQGSGKGISVTKAEGCFQAGCQFGNFPVGDYDFDRELVDTTKHIFGRYLSPFPPDVVAHLTPVDARHSKV